jgi:chemotaxis-related protein WspD
VTLPLVPSNGQADCWRRIGVWGDRSCPELAKVVHCHNCPVFAAAGRRFLDGPAPEAYREEWTERLAAPPEEAATDLQSALIFRLGEEWLALRTQVLVEVAGPRPLRRVPHRGGPLAGLVNIRGELLLCVRLDQVLGLTADAEAVATAPTPDSRQLTTPGKRLIVARRDGDVWVFPVDEVDQVYRFSAGEVTRAPATLARAAARLTEAVFVWRGHAVGCLDDARLFQVLRGRAR